MDKLVLGTAQFGLDYGINNKNGKVSPEEVFLILEKALERKLDVIETAFTYGDSERVIGDFIRRTDAPLQVISKLPLCKPEEVSTMCQISMERLGQNKLYGYMIHDFEHYHNKPELWNALVDLKDDGRVEKIGISVYCPNDLKYLLDKKINIDIVQMPYSVFDQRFSAYFPTLKALGIEIHVRSIFLQGLVFKDMNKLHGKFHVLKSRVKTLNILSRRLGISVSSIYLNFAVSNDYIDSVIFGIDNKEQFEDNIHSRDCLDKVKDIYDEIARLKEEGEGVISTRTWTRSLFDI